MGDVTYFAHLLHSCNDLHLGRQIHARIHEIPSLGSHLYLSNLLVLMYGRCGSVKNAQEVFDSISYPNDFSWNIMLGVYSQNGHLQEAKNTFDRMPNPNAMILIGVFPDSFTFSSVLAACSHGGLLKNGTKLFVLLSGEHQVTPHVEHYSSMVDIYSRVGLVTEAQELIDMMPFFPQPETLRALLNACRIQKQLFRASAEWLDLDSNSCVSLSNIYK
ncbi:hypothetical protein SELMODRAFT_132312 [Selaginella moellendorffii]|uniref:Pentatricopeptide repeat-containing protein n=1 Tax=Selaginella moellendorffii TaxID=88036 RepID=D8T5J2_SELML|nr:hypothetical protein SELMODRAFT_132312 [Selaginella moellendorffii]